MSKPRIRGIVINTLVGPTRAWQIDFEGREFVALEWHQAVAGLGPLYAARTAFQLNMLECYESDVVN